MKLFVSNNHNSCIYCTLTFYILYIYTSDSKISILWKFY